MQKIRIELKRQTSEEFTNNYKTFHSSKTEIRRRLWYKLKIANSFLYLHCGVEWSIKSKEIETEQNEMSQAPADTQNGIKVLKPHQSFLFFIIMATNEWWCETQQSIKMMILRIMKTDQEHYYI